MMSRDIYRYDWNSGKFVHVGVTPDWRHEADRIMRGDLYAMVGGIVLGVILMAAYHFMVF